MQGIIGHSLGNLTAAKANLVPQIAIMVIYFLKKSDLLSHREM